MRPLRVFTLMRVVIPDKKYLSILTKEARLVQDIFLVTYKKMITIYFKSIRIAMSEHVQEQRSILVLIHIVRELRVSNHFRIIQFVGYVYTKTL